MVVETAREWMVAGEVLLIGHFHESREVRPFQHRLRLGLLANLVQDSPCSVLVPARLGRAASLA